MGYFNYHIKIHNLIKEGKLQDFEIVPEHNGIKPALLLHFKDGKTYPIREDRFEEYFNLIEKYHYLKS